MGAMPAPPDPAGGVSCANACSEKTCAASSELTSAATASGMMRDIWLSEPLYFQRERRTRVPLWHAGLIDFCEALTPLTGPRITIFNASSGNGRCNALASSHGAHPDVALFVGGRDHRHDLGVDRFNPRHSVMSRQHARLDKLHSRIGYQPIFDALFPGSPGRHHAANLPACALSSYNLRNPRTIIGHWAFD
jgi:hypothetical protein